MKREGTPKSRREDPKPPSHRIRLPGFLLDDEIGLGDVVKRVTYSMGIESCGGCEKRGAALNRWMRFSR